MATGKLIGTLAGTTVGREALLTQNLVVRDNSKFVELFDPGKVIGVLKPTRTLVVSQSPAAGELVPVGTPIDLVVTTKQQIPVGGIRNVDPKILQRFNGKTIGDVIDTLGDSDAKKVLDRADPPEYDAMSSADKAVVNDYLSRTYQFDAAADPAAAKNAYDTMKFLYTL